MPIRLSQIWGRKRRGMKKYASFNKITLTLFTISVLYAFIITIVNFKFLHRFELETKFLKLHDFNHRYMPSDGFSGCLVLKDDNDRITEWLAYHWLVLPLKYLVVAVDPTGTTSPESILKLWNSSNMGMDIVLWNDIDFDHWIG